jgi:peptidoglycan-associated lipoprotein
MKQGICIGLIIFLGLLAHSSVHAQRNPARSADEAFDRKQYSIAIDRYKKAYNKTRRNSGERERISYRLAQSYQYTGNYKRAEATYRRLTRTEIDKTFPEMLLNFADVLKMNQKFDEAIQFYQLFAERIPDDPRGKLGAETTAQVKEWIENPSKYELTFLKKINSRESDFAATWASNNYNEIIFTSTRENATGKEKDGWTNQSFSDLFVSRLDRKDEWSTPVLLDESETINTKANEGAPHMNSKYTTLYFTRCANDQQVQSGCQIYYSTRSGRNWSSPKLLAIQGVDTLEIIGHPTLSENELILYFSAERRGGFGGKDIWVALRNSAGDEFKRPLNIGPVVNTKGDEVFPFLRNDTTLFFASNGHGGMGGLDIFVTSVDTAGNWSQPRNLKYPVNSTADDFAIIFHPEEERGFLSSNRDNTRNVDNIYYFTEPPVFFTISGTVTNEKTLQFVENAVIKLIGSDGSSVGTRTNDKGFFQFGQSQVNKNTTYEIVVDKENFFTKSAMETTVGVEFSRDFTKDFILEPIPEEPIVLPDILYDLARWELKPQYEDSLQGLILTLQLNPTIIIELASHTDNRDTDERNFVLSQRRAQSVVDYLILRGIEPGRLVAKGYGEIAPRKLERDISVNGFKFQKGTILSEQYINGLASNDEKEAAHQLNRRTEFKVLSKDFVPKPANQPVEQQVEILINPDEEFSKFRTEDKTGAFIVPFSLDGHRDEFTYDRNSQPSVSLEKALELLRKGVINKDNFKGDADNLISAGSIADKAVFTIKELRIAERVLNNVEITVYHNLKYGFVFGQRTLSQYGSFEFNTKTMQLLFR